jgi:hypothetical protein
VPNTKIIDTRKEPYMRKQIIPLIAAMGLLAAVPFDSPGAGHPRSGVAGEVFIYVCPRPIPGVNCYRPYPTSISVITDKGRLVTELMTDEAGRFEVFLKPGKYILIPEGAGESTFPSVDAVAVRVEKKLFTPVRIVYDSGIR